MTFQYKLRCLAECIGQLLAIHLVLHLDSETGMLGAKQNGIAVTVLYPLVGGIDFLPSHFALHLHPFTIREILVYFKSRRIDG